MQKELSDQAKTAIAYEIKASKQRIRIIELADPLYELGVVGFVSGEDIFLKGTESYPEFVKQLTECKKAMHAASYNLDMNRYYMSGNQLAIVYAVSVHWDAEKQKLAEVIMFCSDAHRALEAVSGGSCKIQEQQRTEQQVMCEVQHD